MPETYPKTIHKLPTKISEHAVLAWVTIRNSAGSYPGGYVLAHNPAEVQPYVVWTAYTPDGGETWHASGGSYHFAFNAAAGEFGARMLRRNIAAEALTEPKPCYCDPKRAIYAHEPDCTGHPA